MRYPRLRTLRHDYDYTQEEIAKLLNVTRPQYSLYETGKREIPISLLIKLSKIYDKSIDFMVGISGNPKRYPEPKE